MEALWEKLQFWKQNQVKYKVNVDYKFLPSPDDGIEEKVTAIGILKGKYSGVLNHYEKARVKEEAFRDTHTMVMHNGVEMYVDDENQLQEVPSFE